MATLWSIAVMARSTATAFLREGRGDPGGNHLDIHYRVKAALPF